jgi:hypothetical protein
MLHEQFLVKWERVRQKGRDQFIWIRGVIAWGGSMAIIMSLFFYFGSPRQERWTIPLFLAPLCAFGGYMFGAWLWKNMERRYEETALLLKAASRAASPDELEKAPPSEAIHRPHGFFPV